jgi:hypothetical protein
VLPEHHAQSALFRASAPLSPRLQGQEGMQNLKRLNTPEASGRIGKRKEVGNDNSLVSGESERRPATDTEK